YLTPFASSGFFDVMIGFVAPQSVRLKDRLMSLRMAERVPRLAGALQLMDESTRLFLARIIASEERRIGFDLVSGPEPNCADAVDRLFEFHCIEVARWLSRRLPRTERN